MTIGTFDGVHLGHRHLVRQVVRRARELGCIGGAITFHPHPRVVVTGRGPASLCTLDERLALLRGRGLDVALALPFTPELARLPALDFVRLLCQSVRLRELWVGSDFALGHGREGTVTRLAEIGRDLGFRVHGVPPLVVDGQPVSSTLIRRLVGQGQVEAAARLLGRRYQVAGTLLPEGGRSHDPARPTATVVVSGGLALPAAGAYAVRVRSGDSQWSTTACVEPGRSAMALRLDLSLLGSTGHLFGRPLQIEFVRRLRPGASARPVWVPMERAPAQRPALGPDWPGRRAARSRGGQSHCTGQA